MIRWNGELVLVLRMTDRLGVRVFDGLIRGKQYMLSGNTVIVSPPSSGVACEGEESNGDGERGTVAAGMWGLLRFEDEVVSSTEIGDGRVQSSYMSTSRFGMVRGKIL